MVGEHQDEEEYRKTSKSLKPSNAKVPEGGGSNARGVPLEQENSTEDHEREPKLSPSVKKKLGIKEEKGKRFFRGGGGERG